MLAGLSFTYVNDVKKSKLTLIFFKNKALKLNLLNFPAISLAFNWPTSATLVDFSAAHCCGASVRVGKMK